MAAAPADRQPVRTMSCRVRSPGIKYCPNGGAPLHGDAVRALVAWRDAVDRVFGKARGSGSRAARLELLEVTKGDTGPVPAQPGAAIPSGRLIRDMRVPEEYKAKNARARGYYGHGGRGCPRRSVSWVQFDELAVDPVAVRRQEYRPPFPELSPVAGERLSCLRSGALPTAAALTASGGRQGHQRLWAEEGGGPVPQGQQQFRGYRASRAGRRSTRVAGLHALFTGSPST